MKQKLLTLLLVGALVISLIACGSDISTDEVKKSSNPNIVKTVETVSSLETLSIETQSQTYILNTNTKKFHIPSCSSVGQMNEENKQAYYGNREDVIAQGYDPCGRCHP